MFLVFVPVSDYNSNCFKIVNEHYLDHIKSTISLKTQMFCLAFRKKTSIKYFVNNLNTHLKIKFHNCNSDVYISKRKKHYIGFD